MQALMRYRYSNAVIVLAKNKHGYWSWSVTRGKYEAERIMLMGHCTRRGAFRAARRSLKEGTGLKSGARNWKLDRLDK